MSNSNTVVREGIMKLLQNPDVGGRGTVSSRCRVKGGKGINMPESDVVVAKGDRRSAYPLECWSIIRQS